MCWKHCMPLVMFCLSGTSILARPYYVDPAKGNAGAGGSARAPLRSLARLAGKLKPGDTVYLAAGTYAEQVSLTASGTSQNPIVIRNGKDDPEARFIAGHNLVHGTAAPPSRYPAVDPTKVYFRALRNFVGDPLFID